MPWSLRGLLSAFKKEVQGSKLPSRTFVAWKSTASMHSSSMVRLKSIGSGPEDMSGPVSKESSGGIDSFFEACDPPQSLCHCASSAVQVFTRVCHSSAYGVDCGNFWTTTSGITASCPAQLKRCSSGRTIISSGRCGGSVGPATSLFSQVLRYLPVKRAIRVFLVSDSQLGLLKNSRHKTIWTRSD